jgi:oligopeptide/dipeptide ABC transporter ATP-binding protein
MSNSSYIAAGVPLLEARNLSVRYKVGTRTLSALIDASLSVFAGETVALVGESGSGKSTLAMAMMRARRQKSGDLLYRGRSILRASDSSLREFRRDVQMIFQDPYSSLNPRMTVEQIIEEGLRAHRVGNKDERHERVRALLETVGLPADAIDRRPAQFSGGQRQRIAIARSLALDPSLIIADEPVSSLDVSIQAQVVNLLQRMQQERGISYLLVSHDLPLVHHLAKRVVVLYLGRVVEIGMADEIVRNPQHPYTAALLSAAPSINPETRRERIVLTGSPPSPISRPLGCEFHPRCPIARDVCRTTAPPLEKTSEGRSVACFFPNELPGINPPSLLITPKGRTE